MIKTVVEEFQEIEDELRKRAFKLASAKGLATYRGQIQLSLKILDEAGLDAVSDEEWDRILLSEWIPEVVLTLLKFTRANGNKPTKVEALGTRELNSQLHNMVPKFLSHFRPLFLSVRSNYKDPEQTTIQVKRRVRQRRSADRHRK